MPIALLHPTLAELAPEPRREVIRRTTLRMAQASLRGLPAFPFAFVLLGAAAHAEGRLGLVFVVSAVIALLATAWRGWLAWRLARGRVEAGQPWRLVFGLSVLVSALGWGLAAGSVVDSDALEPAAFLAFAISIALISQIASINATLLWLADAYLVALAAPLVVELALAPFPASLGAVGAVLYLTYCALDARAAHRRIWRSAVDAKLLAERNAQLEGAQDSLREARDSLEAQVRDRTAAYRRADLELREREQDYRQIFEAVHDAILIFRPEGEIILDVNRRACEIYGYEKHELVGHSILEFSFDPAGGERRVAETLEGAAPTTFRTRQRRRDGSELVLDVNAAVIEFRGETAILSVNRDVTEQLRHEELRLAKQTAEQANRAKSGFLANMSHEIRTPMAGIIGISDLMLKTDLDERQRGYTSTIQTSALSLLEVIDDILDFSKIEAGKLTLDRTAVDVRDLIERAVDLLQPRAAAKGIELQARIDPRLPGQLVAPSARLRQVALNLLSNAVKFTEDGEVEMAVEVLAQDERLARLRFSVRDTGIGMASSLLPHLFTPFTQADASTSRRFGGTGLGLAISQQLVKLMGGYIEVRSRQGQGSVFSFELTLGIVDSPSSSAERAPRRPPGGGARILVAEDNPVNQMVILEQLAALGYTADAAVNGEEVLRAVEQTRYDLVLMDCQMPGLDGYEATRRLRALDHGQLPVIALTAHAMAGDRQKCLEAGMDDYISKPFTEARLVQTLQRWLHGGDGDSAEDAGAPRAGADRGPAREADGLSDPAGR